MNICIYGASSDNIDPLYRSPSYELGALIAEKGYGIVFGGGKNGLMGEAARGCRSKNGTLIGIAPGFFFDWGVIYDGCTEFIRTDTMHSRKGQMEALSGAFVCLPGGIGTYEELFEILTWKKLGIHKKPIAILNINGYFDPVVELLSSTAEKGFMPKEDLAFFRVCGTPEEVLAYIEESIGQQVYITL